MLTNSDRPCLTPASKEPHHDHRTIHARRPRRQSLTDPGDEMLTLQEARRFLRRPEGTLRYWRHLGAGPRRFKLGRHVRYWRTDLVHWLTEQTNRPQERG